MFRMELAIAEAKVGCLNDRHLSEISKILLNHSPRRNYIKVTKRSLELQALNERDSWNCQVQSLIDQRDRRHLGYSLTNKGGVKTN